MVITITSRSTKAEIEAALKKLEKMRHKQDSHKEGSFNALKYCGVIKLKEDPLSMQKNMRNEWQ